MQSSKSSAHRKPKKTHIIIKYLVYDSHEPAVQVAETTQTHHNAVLIFLSTCPESVYPDTRLTSFFLIGVGGGRGIYNILLLLFIL